MTDPQRCRTCGERDGPGIPERSMWLIRHRPSCETWDKPENLRSLAASLEAEAARLRKLADFRAAESATGSVS